MSSLRYDTMPSPIGDLLLVRSDRGLVRLAFDDEPAEAILEEVADRLGAEPVPADLADERVQLEEYFAGARRSFDLPVDTTLIATPFGKRVLEATADIPYGEVAGYGEVAEHAGSPRGARAAGNALNGNPVPVVVPCHRVVPSTGGIGGYGGREDRKAFLLQLEGALPRGDR